MQRRKPEPERSRCTCGRSRRDAATTVYRSSQKGRFIYHRCECGIEWTEHQVSVDPSEPISSDELLEVHEQLAGFDGPISLLLGLKTS
jgi:hypothetical protein